MEMKTWNYSFRKVKLFDTHGNKIMLFDGAETPNSCYVSKRKTIGLNNLLDIV